MIPTSTMDMWGPMYTSRFYDVPAEQSALDAYVDRFTASGGGAVEESALEALWYALIDPNWRDGSTTVRAILQWTDAPARPFHDKTEITLNPGYDPYWETALQSSIGSDFLTKSYAHRLNYMYDTFYPADAPADTAQLQALFDAFHAENANGFEGVNTLTVNVIKNCLSQVPCGEWPTVATWDGVTLNQSVGVDASAITYDTMVRQIADTVENQINTKNLRLLR